MMEVVAEPALPPEQRAGINLFANRGLEPLEIQKRARALDLFGVWLREVHQASLEQVLASPPHIVSRAP